MIKSKLASRLLSLLVTGLFLVLSLPGNAVAQSLSQDDIDSIYNDSVWYALGGGNFTCSASVDADLSGNSNAQKAFNFLVSMGLSPTQSAGVVGNMTWESGVVPEKIQGGDTSQNPADAGSNGWGIVQWTPADTKVPGIVRDAHISGPVYELGTQLQMLWAQLSGTAGGYSETQAGNDIKGTTTVSDAVRAFQGDSNIGGKYTGFERPADESATLAKRIDLANQALNDFGGSATGTTVSTPPTTGGCSPVGPGQDTQYIDGFTVYSQYDPSWADKPYGTTTIADAGCGPSAMAMIITALTGRQVTPDITAAYATAQNLYIQGVGSSWSIASVLSAHWSLNAQAIGANVARITATLQNGGLVIASGEGPLPFTSGGHYIVIRGVTADGKWKIGDSGHNNTSSQEWDPQQLVASMNDGSVYAITK